MKNSLSVCLNNVQYLFTLGTSDYYRFFLKDEFVIDVFKMHSHCYYYKAFFYKSISIYSSSYFNSKYKLFCAIQNLLKQELYDVVQF